MEFNIQGGPGVWVHAFIAYLEGGTESGKHAYVILILEQSLCHVYIFFTKPQAGLGWFDCENYKKSVYWIQRENIPPSHNEIFHIHTAENKESIKPLGRTMTKVWIHFKLLDLSLHKHRELILV